MLHMYPYRKNKVVATLLQQDGYHLVTNLLQQACNRFLIETVTTLHMKNITTFLQGNAVFNKSVMLNSLYTYTVCIYA